MTGSEIDLEALKLTAMTFGAAGFVVLVVIILHILSSRV